MTIQIESPNELRVLTLQSCYKVKREGYRISDKVFFDPSTGRIDPIAACWWYDINVTSEQAEPFIAGFAKKSITLDSEEKIEYYNAGRFVRKKILYA